MGEKNHLCPVCGYAGLDEPHTDTLGEPTYAICPSCGTQFGADDLVTGHDELRRAWVEGGAQWWSEAKPAPSGWNGLAQLKSAGFSTEPATKPAPPATKPHA